MTTNSEINAPFYRPAMLKSKAFFTEADSCLKFYYHVRGSGNEEDLYLKVYANYTNDNMNQTVNILNISGTHGEIWREHQMTLPPGKFSVIFEASSSSNMDDASLDDILLRTGRCIINTTHGKVYLLQLIW